MTRPWHIQIALSALSLGRGASPLGLPSTLSREPLRRLAPFAWLASLALVFLYPNAVTAAEWHVATGGSGTGTASAPFGRVQDALRVAQPGDSIAIGPGTFNERLASVRGGAAAQPIRIYAVKGRGTTVITNQGRVLTVTHPYVTVDGLVLDGQFGADDLVSVGSAATGFTLRNSEVRRTSRDAIDLGPVTDVLIENSVIHHALNAAGGRTDAHGIVGGAVRRLTIRNTEVHTFSGDAVQVDAGRSAPGWTDVVIDGCRFWLEPLPSATNGFPAGAVPGENAVDTKASAAFARARITIRNTEAHGFQRGLINNMAAFNLKEHIDATIDGVTVFDSEIAFRLRAPALVRVQNSVVYSVATGVRYEDDISDVRVWNTTFGRGISSAFTAASSAGSTLDVRNFLMLGTALPREAKGSSNMAVPAAAFVNAAADNYQLAAGAAAVDAGVSIPDVAVDRQGTKRPQGKAFDIGAFERVSSSPPNPSGGEIVLYAARAPVVSGNWQPISDATAAGVMRLASANEGASVVKTPLARPIDYFELTFAAEPGRPYRLWIRGEAYKDKGSNDSVFVQFSDSVDAAGRAVFRIGSTAATAVIMADCGNCGLSGWGWQDNATGAGVLGPVVYFEKSGTHTIRIQTREDGLSIDQIVLSPSDYLTTPPGSARDDATILPESLY